MNVSFFQELLSSISEKGLRPLDLSPASSKTATVESLAALLLAGKGEASGVALACQVVERYRELDAAGKLAFFQFINEQFRPRIDGVKAAAAAFLENPGPDTMGELAAAVESPRQEFFRQLNRAPGGTAGIVQMRADLLDLLKENPALKPVDADLVHLFSSWFNRGFLVMRRIGWWSPALVLEKVMEYEAVHKIRGWDDLRRRLEPADRRCFAFFHPSLVDDPLIFVEVALEADIPDSIQSVLEQETRAPAGNPNPAVAAFYSISNCQRGLTGISFGNFLIKQVVEDLATDIPSLNTFVTLSPIPGFRRWLERAAASNELEYLDGEQRELIEGLDDFSWAADEDHGEALKPLMISLAAHYFLLAKTPDGRPLDPVARFHLGNGARIERINWLGDTSGKGLRESHGMMVNYRYELKDIERNHEAYANHGTITASKAVKGALLAKSGSRALVPSNTPV